jgi:hypothetical protein
MIPRAVELVALTLLSSFSCIQMLFSTAEDSPSKVLLKILVCPGCFLFFICLPRPLLSFIRCTGFSDGMEFE